MHIDFYDHLRGTEIVELIDQHVTVDGWDYMLFFGDNEEGEPAFDFNDYKMRPDDMRICKMLSGTYKNVWYLNIKFKGKKGILGVAYNDEG